MEYPTACSNDFYRVCQPMSLCGVCKFLILIAQINLYDTMPAVHECVLLMIWQSFSHTIRIMTTGYLLYAVAMACPTRNYRESDPYFDSVIRTAAFLCLLLIHRCAVLGLFSNDFFFLLNCYKRKKYVIPSRVHIRSQHAGDENQGNVG